MSDREKRERENRNESRTLMLTHGSTDANRPNHNQLTIRDRPTDQMTKTVENRFPELILLSVWATQIY